ncbi:sugar ABC transporter substrate-binding protein [Christensenella tenuis]|uniref:Sugar ABC transporter substrate-binding protein n=1 Tax=Christensenella tenuis TaxID=2763033 RepID=A0ABR7EGK9_9FIRM|nr:sugar ABC transporter substrate-binding protein [Christensenella tenuis]MBC5648896.1 sugar ABC transporter substrate-binding protein [Christensenella tenuis]
MKKLVGIFLVVIFGISLIACSQAATPATETSTGSAGTEVSSGNGEALRIGYIENFASHEFYQNIIKGMKQTAEENGWSLEIADANGDISKQISLGENMLAKDVDALIVTPVDAKGVMPLIEQAEAAGVPVITEAVPLEKQTCYVGIDDFYGGYIDGQAAGEYANENNIVPKVLVVGAPALEVCVQRVEGFKTGLQEVCPEAEIVVEVDGGGTKDTAVAVATDALTANPDINMVMGINDDSTLGGLLACEAAGMDMSQVTGFGFGVEGIAAKNELVNPDSSYKGGLGMFPEMIGRLCVEMAAKAANGEEVPVAITTPLVVMNGENVTEYYEQDGDSWEIKWESVEELGYTPRDTVEIQK